MSARHLVIAEFPLVVNPMSLLLWLKPYIENFRWEPERGTRFHVFDRATGAHVRTVTTPAFFAFHHVNAFESDGDLVVDLVGYDDASIIDAFYLHRLEEPDVQVPPGTLRRFRIPLAGGDGQRRGALRHGHRAAEPGLRAHEHEPGPPLRLRGRAAGRAGLLRPAGQGGPVNPDHVDLVRVGLLPRRGCVRRTARPGGRGRRGGAVGRPRRTARHVVPAGARRVAPSPRWPARSCPTRSCSATTGSSTTTCRDRRRPRRAGRPPSRRRGAASGRTPTRASRSGPSTPAAPSPPGASRRTPRPPGPRPPPAGRRSASPASAT